MNKNEKLSDIIGKCDDEFITKASVDATPIAKRRISIAPFAAAVACVCLVGGGVFAYSQSIKDKNPQSSASSENELIAQQDSSQNAIEIAPEKSQITELEIWNALSGFWNGADNSFCLFKPQDSENGAYFATSFWESEWGNKNGAVHDLTFSNTNELTFVLYLNDSAPDQDSEGAICDVIVDYSKLKQNGVIHVYYGDEDFGEFAYAGATQEEAFENYVNGTNAEPDIYQEPQWDDKNFYQQSPCFNFNNIAYVAAGETYAEIGEKLGTATANNVDIYTGTEFNVELEIFEVISVDNDYAVAVKTTDGFYGVYTNCDYTTATFGDMVEGLNLEENLRFDSCGIQTETDMTVSYTNISNTDDDAIWGFLADCYDAQSVGDYTEFDGQVFMDGSDILDDYISFAVASDVLAFENLSFAVTKGGYITTNIISTGRAFYIGVDKANELAQMLEESNDAETVVGDKIPMFDDDDTDNTETMLTLPYGPINDSQSATLIAEFKETMGEAPLNLTTTQANSILQKISGLVLCKVDDASEIEFPTGGGIIFEIVDGNRYNIIGENILWYNGDYYLIENDTTALISELTSLLGGTAPVQDHNFEAEIVEVYENNSVLLECISSSETGIVGVGDQITANLPQGSTVAVGDIVSVNYDGNIGETYPMILLGHYTITVVE